MTLTLEVEVGQEISVGDNVTIRLQHKSGRKARLVFESTGKPVPIELRKTRNGSLPEEYRGLKK